MANEQNLKPFTGADDPRRMNGKPKGTKHLSTWIQQMLNDEDFETYLQHPTKGYEEFKGAPIKAIVTVAMRKALAGDDRAMEWLAKHGYGTKMILEVGDPVAAALEKLGLGDQDAGETEDTSDSTSESVS